MCSIYSESLPRLAITLILMRCFKKLILQHIKASLDPHHLFLEIHRKHHSNCPLLNLHTLTKTTPTSEYCLWSSAQHTIFPVKLIGKFHTLGLSTTICNWILDFPTNRPQTVQLDSHTPSTLVMNS